MPSVSLSARRTGAGGSDGGGARLATSGSRGSSALFGIKKKVDLEENVSEVFTAFGRVVESDDSFAFGSRFWLAYFCTIYGSHIARLLIFCFLSDGWVKIMLKPFILRRFAV